VRTTDFQPSTQLFKGFTVFARIQVGVLTISHNDCSFCSDEFFTNYESERITTAT